MGRTEEQVNEKERITRLNHLAPPIPLELQVLLTAAREGGYRCVTGPSEPRPDLLTSPLTSQSEF